MNISIVIPVYNEERGIEEFFRRCRAVIEKLPHAFSFVAVNDGSKDKSLQKLLEMKKTFSCPITIIDLSRNFGHGNALTAGIHHAKGDAIIIMDADLEDPPELIPQLIEEFEHGKDVVYTVKTRREDTLLRRLAFRTFHSLFARMTNLDIPEGSGSYCLMSQKFAEEFKRLQESNRFIPGLRAYIGFEPGYVSYTKERRFSGIPKQTFLRLIDLSLNAFFLFSNAPLWTLSILLLAGIGLSLAAIASPYTSVFVTNFLPLISMIVLLQLWIIGTIAYKAHIELLKRPAYIVKKVYE